MLENMDPVVLPGAEGAFPPLLDIPPDADDETMVELAIALSLQVRPSREARFRHLQRWTAMNGRPYFSCSEIATVTDGVRTAGYVF